MCIYDTNMSANGRYLMLDKILHALVINFTGGCQTLTVDSRAFSVKPFAPSA
ncbi:hypothetical protein AUEXF2481DRAFT_40541 [Aureobasidium subglaciale EXF-2481]|uniref:Uncharacterized protein n=1 Tax=Aureobasidium subglaciale (strain EXF-2481) TaxID=1043005 RepID=A0A074YA30_AURSE|nr:uncharacterized protein AUEXF2481DRAFT_40541 [Aureobasidium subglaciale EXF-2481]KEQ94608.1 hypothetical protein AUEXF2481DRAFT_40541 [Aureobasidium subglaciale EXF-2481]